MHVGRGHEGVRLEESLEHDCFSVDQASSALGDDAYSGAHAEGQALSLDQALALARAMPR